MPTDRRAILILALFSCAYLAACAGQAPPPTGALGAITPEEAKTDAPTAGAPADFHFRSTPTSTLAAALTNGLPARCALKALNFPGHQLVITSTGPVFDVGTICMTVRAEGEKKDFNHCIGLYKGHQELENGDVVFTYEDPDFNKRATILVDGETMAVKKLDIVHNLWKTSSLSCG